MKIDDRAIMVPPYDGPNKTKLEDQKLTAEQVEAMFAKMFGSEIAEVDERSD